MDLNDVILTPKETEKLANNHLEKHGCLDTFTRERDKAQCLKLLEWLDAPCNIEEHHVCEAALGWPRQNCRFCMYEIRKLLKEQND